MTSSPVALICCLTIPVLILFAYVYWAKMTRRTLPHWRNALGQVAMLVVSSEWLLHTLGWVFYSLGTQTRAFRDAENCVGFRNLLHPSRYGCKRFPSRVPPTSCHCGVAFDGSFRGALLHCLINALTGKVGAGTSEIDKRWPGKQLKMTLKRALFSFRFPR